MIILIGTILFLIISIILFVIGNERDYYDGGESLIIVSVWIFVVFIIGLVTQIVIIVSKPYDYKKFKTNYDTIKETLTSADDIRDATFTKEIIDINKEIRECRTFENSKWIGVYQNKKICKLSLLEK